MNNIIEKFKKGGHKYLLYVAAGILLAVIIGGLSVSKGWVGQTRESAGVPGESGGAGAQTLTYLPETYRTVEENQPRAGLSPEQLRDPFAGAMALRGVILGGDGGDLAVIETGSTAYIVGKGEKIAGDWTVADIKSGTVLLKSDNRELQLEFSGRATDPTPRQEPEKESSTGDEGEVEER